MRLDTLRVKVRPMPADRAMDLGLAMAQAWYGSLWTIGAQNFGVALFGIVAWTAWAYASGVEKSAAATGLLYWAFFCWWLKPLAQARLLGRMSKKLFGEQGDLPFSWTWLRFLGFWRFRALLLVYMATTLLEGQSDAKACKTRAKTLGRGAGLALTRSLLTFFAIEIVFFVGAWTLLWQLLTVSSVAPLVEIDAYFFAWPLWAMAALWALYFLAQAAAMPFFVASGFALYVCQRSLLEAWDIELAFRAMGKRFADAAAKKNQGGKRA